jgi:hypothetical protein
MQTNHLQKIKVAGHLEDKRGIYQMALSWKVQDGKRVRKSISTGLTVKGNKKRAEAMMREKCDEMEQQLMAEQDGAAATENDGMLFADFMEHQWLGAMKNEVKVTVNANLKMQKSAS